MADATAVTPAELGLPEALPMPRRTDWRIGMIGFGGIARQAHVPSYREVGWPIVAVADPDPAAQQAAREAGIETVYADFCELIADPQVEIVDLLTQPTVREEVVEAAAAAGKPLVTEKPFGVSVASCTRMVEMMERAGLPLAVHQNYRWMPANFLAAHIVRAGLIGRPFYTSIEIFGDQDVHLAGHPFYSQCTDFLTLQWNNHLADLMRYWTGAEALRTFARTGRMAGQSFVSDNLLCALTDFGPGLTGQIVHHELLHSSLGGVQCRVDGDQGSVVFDFWSDTIALDSRVLGGGPRALDLSGANYVRSFAGSMADFLLAIEEGREPMVSGRRNLPTIRTVLAQDESARAGGAWVACV